jgi:hypothetical protein
MPIPSTSDEEYEPPTDSEEEIEEQEQIQAEIQEQVSTERANEIFLAFIQTPFFDKIRTCARCQKFFLNESGHRNKQFCSARCARIASAMQSKQRKQQQKLARLERAVQKLPRSVKDAKIWLAKNARVSLHFVTRAVNQGQIQLKKET